MKLSTKEQNRIRSNYGPWAVITGATSGIGEEIAKQLAVAGVNLVVSSRGDEGLKQLQERLTSAYHIHVKIVPCDMADTNQVNELIQATKELEVGLLVVSAGFGTSGSFLHSSLYEEMNMLKVNCEALLMLTHHFSQYFAHKKRGGIILMSSMVGFQGVPYAAHYAATKAYVQSLAEALSLELKPSGVDVLAAAPGPVNSGFGKRANMKMDMYLTPEQVGVPILKALGKKSTVLPGALTKLLVYSLRTVPRWGKIRIMKMVMGGMTNHQRA